MHRLRLLAMLFAAALLWSCSSTKHVPEGQLLLDKVNIQVVGDSIDTKELFNFLRQQPNHKVLGFTKLQLATYSLSGHDSTKWYNRWLQKLGQPPVIFDKKLTEQSRSQLLQAFINRGYMNASVTVDTLARPEKKKMEVTYDINPGVPHYIKSIEYNISDPEIEKVLYADTAQLHLDPGMLFDRNRLEEYRTGVTYYLRNQGYYDFNKDYITFTADTCKGAYGIDLTVNIIPRKRPFGISITDTDLAMQDGNDYEVVAGEEFSYVMPDTAAYQQFRFRNVYFITDYTPQGTDSFNFGKQDTVRHSGIIVLYGDDHYIAPSLLEEKCFIQSGAMYSAQAVERTYEALSQLGILKFINIEMRQVGWENGYEWLDAYVLLSRNKKQGITLELEGTNSEGDLGFGVGLTYQHRDLGHRSNLLTVKARTSYESLSGNFEGFVNKRYTENAGEIGITFPRFEFPFLSRNFKRKRRATTELTTSFNYQERPEYTRVIVGAAWGYKWTHRRGSRQTRYQYNLIDINYVRLPHSTLNFLDSIAPTNPLLRYSYEDHFIMRMGLSYYVTNKRAPGTSTGTNTFTVQPFIKTVRGSIEVAGNLLYALSKITGQRKDDGAYKIFGIQYAQYVKAESDYSYTLNLNARNALAFHVGGGIAVPYLNSRMVPFEKRFYAGGANGVRGWGVRSLGPGSYDSRNSVTDFINQCGDILFNANVEYRAKLFWVFEGALFIDVGNVWTIRNYENQPGGVFRFNKFYKQIAGAYGVGLRLDFTYFLLRFDLGMKAHNPAQNQEPWPLIHPNWHRDAQLHFSVGYPF